MKKSKEEIEGLGNLYLINETREKVEDDIPEVYTQDDIIKAVAWGYDAGLHADRWHYPSKGEYPKDDEEVLCCFYGLTSFKVGWYDITDQSWCFHSSIIYPKGGADNIIAWQYIVPPKEEA